jgi:hypothetical protein
MTDVTVVISTGATDIGAGGEPRQLRGPVRLPPRCRLRAYPSRNRGS